MAFYSKHIPDDQSIISIFHGHWIIVLDSFLLWISFGALIPSFLYYQSERLRDIVPFATIEILLFLVFLKILYELYNWYNDIWIITDVAVYDIEWSLLKTKVESVHFESLEGVEVEKHRIWDSILNKGDIVLHRLGEDELALYNVANPYAAANIIEEILSGKPPEEEEVDRFDMIMDTLSHVVKDYLDKNGLPDTGEKRTEHIQEPEEASIDDFTLDLRDETTR